MFQRREILRIRSAFKDHLTYFCLKSGVLLLFFSCWTTLLHSHAALFQTLEYHEWAPEVHLDMLTCLSESPPIFTPSYFIITSAIGIGHSNIYPKTTWGQVLLLALYAMIIIYVPRNV